MTYFLKSQLAFLLPAYRSIQNLTDTIEENKKKLRAAEARLDAKPAGTGYKPGHYAAAEEARQREERKKLEEKVGENNSIAHKVFIALLYIGFLVGLALLGSRREPSVGKFLSMLISALIPAALPTAIVGIIPYNIIKSWGESRANARVAALGPFKLEKNAMDQAKRQDAAAKKAYNDACQTLHNQNKAEYDRIKAMCQQQNPVLQANIKQLQLMADQFLKLPEDFSSLQGLSILVDSYDACCREWCDGNDPEDIVELACYCRAQEMHRKQRSKQANLAILESQYLMAARRREEEAFSQAQSRQRAELHRQAELLEEESKRLEDIYKEIHS